MSNDTSEQDARSDHAPTGDPADAPYAALNGIVHAEQSLTQTLTQVAELARQVIEGAEDISITVLQRTKIRSVAFTGHLAIALDERQYEDGYGPCVDAARTGQTIEIPDTARDTSYPNFSRLAHRQGVRRTLSIGIPTRHDVSAGMNVYARSSPGPFSQQTRDIAGAFAGYASTALLNATLYTAQREETEQIRAAMASRAEIEQAKGILMREHRCTADEAFDLLRLRSGREHRKIRDLAKTVIEDAVDRSR